MNLRTTILALLLGASCLGAAAAPQAAGLPRKSLFDSSWRFCLGDKPDAARADFDDSAWRVLSLPHDWSIEQPIDRNAPAGNDGGYYPTGIGWYRKTFTAPASLSGEKVYLYFEGVYMNSSVYLNGKLIGGHPYGYSSFWCDASAAIVPGGENVVSVRVDNSQQKNCRWYSGSGIYRHVWLIHTPQLHIDNWGVAIHTSEVSADAAKVSVRISLSNESSEPRTFSLTAQIEGAEDAVSRITMAPGSRQEVTRTLTVRQPRLWDIDSPELYDARVCIEEDGRVVDSYTQRFGIRTVEASTEGFFLNGRKLEITGGSLHHDNGILGAAAYDRAEYRKVRLMKEAGFNAIRTSHNIPSEAFLDACDRLGILVMEDCFDGWRDAKTPHDYSTLFDRYWKEDVQSMVLRDLNHPAIIAWNIGNEVIERKKIEIVTTARKLRAAVRQYDDRIVTSALAAWDSDWEIYDPLAEQLDVVGYNYLIHKEKEDHDRVPSRIMWQTESYPRDAFRNWTLVQDRDYIIGDFVWTGIDYLGESGIGRWWYDGETPGEHYQADLYPCHAAYCGDIDLTGWRKPISHYRSLLYGDSERLYLAVKEPDGYYGTVRTGYWAVWPTWESWNWPGHEGKPIEVEVYSKYPTVRLYLDDRLIGEKSVGRDSEFKAVFTVPYAEGTLRAEGLEGGAVKETRSLASASEPYALRTRVENREMLSGGEDLSFVQVEVVDRQGRICPNAEVEISASVSGQGSLAAMGNADIKDCGSYVDAVHKTWKGRALVVVRSGDKAGKVTLKLKSVGLRGATEKIVSR